MKILITGGTGLIGYALVRYLINVKRYSIINVDKSTYAGNLGSLSDVIFSPLHYCGDVSCSWCEFAQAIFLEAKVYGLNTPKNHYSIEAENYLNAAVRPAYSVLSYSMIDENFTKNPSNWRVGITCALEKLRN